MYKLSVIIAIIAFLISCNNNQDPYSLVYDIYDDFPVQYIAVNHSLSDLYTSDYESFPFISRTLGTSHLIISSGRMYTVDNQRKSIREHDYATHEVIREFSFEGRGPGEYLEIGAVFATDSFISIFDRTQSKILTYNSNFEFKYESIISGMRQEDNFVKKDSLVLFHTRSHEQKLFGKLNLSDSSRSYFHDYIIPQGYQPRGYNNSTVHYNNGKFVIASNNMPIVFIYDKKSSKYYPNSILRIQLSSLEMINKPMSFDGGLGSSLIQNPPLERIENLTGQTVGLSPIFQRVRLSQPYMVLQDAQNTTLLILHTDGSTYSHIGNYKIFSDDHVQLNGSDFQIKLPYIYIGLFDENKILRFRLSEVDFRQR